MKLKKKSSDTRCFKNQVEIDRGFVQKLFYLPDGHKNPPSCAKSLWMWLSSEGPSSFLTLNTFYKVPFYWVPFYKSFFTKCLLQSALLQSAFLKSAFLKSAFLSFFIKSLCTKVFFTYQMDTKILHPVQNLCGCDYHQKDHLPFYSHNNVWKCICFLEL